MTSVALPQHLHVRMGYLRSRDRRSLRELVVDALETTYPGRPDDPELPAQSPPAHPAPAAAELPAYTPPKKAQVKAYVPAETAERFQDAWHACRGVTGHRYLSEHISALLAAEAARLEAEHNGGNRFPPRNG
ncbi:hypothetical protein ACWEBH_12555 [Micrococcus endophyticus]